MEEKWKRNSREAKKKRKRSEKEAEKKRKRMILRTRTSELANFTYNEQEKEKEKVGRREAVEKIVDHRVPFPPLQWLVTARQHQSDHTQLDGHCSSTY